MTYKPFGVPSFMLDPKNKHLNPYLDRLEKEHMTDKIKYTPEEIIEEAKRAASRQTKEDPLSMTHVSDIIGYLSVSEYKVFLAAFVDELILLNTGGARKTD